MRPVRDATNSRSFRSPELDRLRVVIRALARGGQRMQRVGVWDPDSSFLQTASRSLVRSVSAQGVPSQQSVLLPRLKTRHFTESGPVRPQRSVSICEVRKDWGGDELRRAHTVIPNGYSDLARSVEIMIGARSTTVSTTPIRSTTGS